MEIVKISFRSIGILIYCCSSYLILSHKTTMSVTAINNNTHAVIPLERAESSWRLLVEPLGLST